MEKRLSAAVPCSQALKSDVDAIHCVGVDHGRGAAGSGHRACHAPTACGPDLLAAGGDWGSSSIGAGPPPWPSTSTSVGGRHGNMARQHAVAAIRQRSLVLARRVRTWQKGKTKTLCAIGKRKNEDPICFAVSRLHSKLSGSNS